MYTGTNRKLGDEEFHHSFSENFTIDRISTHKVSEKSARLLARNFRVKPRPDRPDDAQLAISLQQLTDLLCSDLPAGVEYSLSVGHAAIPFFKQKVYVNFRGHTGNEGQIIVDRIKTLIQSGKPLFFTDNFQLEFATYDFSI